MEKVGTGKGDSTCNYLSQKRGPLIEGMEEKAIGPEHKEGEAKSGSTRGQVPGKGQGYKDTLEGHAGDFGLSPKSSGESLKSLGTGMIGVI